MAQIIVRNLEEKVVDRLKERAKRNGRSLGAEVRMILVESVSFDINRILELHKRMEGRQLPDVVEIIREARDQR